MSVLLCFFMRVEHVRLVMFLAFHVKVDKKSVLSWTKKCLKILPDVYAPVKKKYDKLLLVVHADEKFFKIRGKWAYWWSLVDESGNLITCVITETRDLASAKKLFKNAKLVLGRVDLVVTDGLKSYIKAKNVFGKKTKHVQTHMLGKIVNYAPNKLTFVDNNIVESLNSEIDIFLSRFRYNFSNLESAQRWAKCFMLIRYLLKKFRTTSYASQPEKQANPILQKPLAPFQKIVCW